MSLLLSPAGCHGLGPASSDPPHLNVLRAVAFYSLLLELPLDGFQGDLDAGPECFIYQLLLLLIFSFKLGTETLGECITSLPHPGG